MASGNYSSSDNVNSASRRALELSEILGTILAHFLAAYDDDILEADVDNPIINHKGNGTDVPSAAAVAALRNAALVNRHWSYSALPLLWRCPSESALRNDTITTPARRAIYAAHIRSLYVSRRRVLWHALAGAVNDVGENCVDGGLDGLHGKVACGDIVGVTGTSHAKKQGRSSMLRLPWLRALHVASRWWRRGDSMTRDCRQMAANDQSPLFHLLGADLEEFTGHITAELVDRLEALCVPEAAAAAAGVPSAYLDYDCYYRRQDCCLVYDEASVDRPHLLHMRLRLLHLDADCHGNNNKVVETEERLRVWLTTLPCAVAALESVKLRGLRSQALFDLAFCHFAAHVGLKQFMLDGDCFGYQSELSPSVLKDVVGAWSADNDGDAHHGYQSLISSSHKQPRQHMPRCAPGHNQPFAQLHTLSITIARAALAPLVHMLLPLPSLTRLAIQFGDTAAAAAAAPNTTTVATAAAAAAAAADGVAISSDKAAELAPLAILLRLCGLCVEPGNYVHMTAADLRVLRCLPLLEEQQLSGQIVAGPDFISEVAELLQNLPQLWALKWDLSMGRDWIPLLNVVSEACPHLQLHNLLWRLPLGLWLGSAPRTPLFPQLEVLTTCGIDSGIGYE